MPRLIQLGGHVMGDVERERGLAHRRTRRQNQQLAGVQPARHLVQFREASADAFDALAWIEKSVDAARIAIDDFLRRDQAGALARFAELEQRLFGTRQNLPGLFLAEQGAVHHLLRCEDDAPQQSFVLNDADVAFQVEDVRQAVVERNQVAQAIAGFELAVAHQLVGEGDAIDFFGALAQPGHALENAAVFFQAEIVGIQHAGGGHEVGVVHQDRPEHETLGVEIGGQPLIESGAGRAGHLRNVLPYREAIVHMR